MDIENSQVEISQPKRARFALLRIGAKLRARVRYRVASEHAPARRAFESDLRRPPCSSQRSRGPRTSSCPCVFEPLHVLYLRTALVGRRGVPSGECFTPGQALSGIVRSHRTRRAAPDRTLDVGSTPDSRQSPRGTFNFITRSPTHAAARTPSTISACVAPRTTCSLRKVTLGPLSWPIAETRGRTNRRARHHPAAAVDTTSRVGRGHRSPGAG